MAAAIIPTFNQRIKIHACQLEMGDYNLAEWLDEQKKLKEITYKSEKYRDELKYCLWGYRIDDKMAPWLLNQRLTDRGLIIATLHYLSSGKLFNPKNTLPLDGNRADFLYSFAFNQDALTKLLSDEDFNFLMGGIEEIKLRHFENISERNKGVFDRVAAR